ncbi:MAG: preprotein translocase subunit SecE [Candidatus Anammoxibacter sp.]
MFSVYKRGQGSSARISVGIALSLIAVFAAFSLHGALINLPVFFGGAQIPLLSMTLTWGLISSFFFFLICILFVGILVGCLKTGIGMIDNTGQRVVCYLIDTQGELQKVSWPTRQELVGSTIVVLICAVVLGVYILGVDRFVTTVMKLVKVL